jgi:two-component system, NarL family, response regulator DevR
VQVYASKSLRVFLLDDHDIVRRGIRDLLSPARDITIVGESSSARNATDLILGLETDVMVLDVHLQDGTGIEVCREVRSADPTVTGLLLTASGDDEAALAAILAGAAGFTTKLARSVDLIGTVRAVGAGKTLINPERTAQFVADLPYVTPRLTPRESRILTLVAEGLTDPQIAEQLGGVEVAGLSRDLALLIDRMSGVNTWPSAGSIRPGSGKHRRSDR